MVFTACNNGNTNATTTAQSQPATTAPAPAAKKPERPKIQRAPVTINASTERDYPEVVREQGFPVHPRAEVANVGNAIIEGDGLFMRLNIPDTQEEIKAYYDKEMVALGWTIGKLNIFQGADGAMLYEKNGIICRVIMIDEEDYRKVAVNMTKKVNPEDLDRG